MPRKARTGGTPPGPGMPAPAAAPVSASTLTQIAADAGVSVSTVSKVLNGRTDVSPDTRERIGQLLRKHGYQPGSKLGFGVVDLLLGSGACPPPTGGHGPWAEELIHGTVAGRRRGRAQRRGYPGELRQPSSIAGWSWPPSAARMAR